MGGPHSAAPKDLDSNTYGNFASGGVACRTTQGEHPSNLALLLGNQCKQGGNDLQQFFPLRLDVFVTNLTQGQF